MRVENIQSTCDGPVFRSSAQVVWEDVPRTPQVQTVTFEVPVDFAMPSDLNAAHYLLACFPVALRAGEGRLALEGVVDPDLLIGVQEAMQWLAVWSTRLLRPLRIEVAVSQSVPESPRQRFAASFLSGGIDSLFTIRRNQMLYGGSHPGRISAGVVVAGFDSDSGRTDGTSEAAHDELCAFADVAGIQLIPVRTDLRRLDMSNDAWMHQLHGAALAAVGHSLKARFFRFYVASSYHIAQMPPWGSHPLLDEHYRSCDVQVCHDGAEYTRLEKVRLLAEWQPALAALRVCRRMRHANCGRCEKCVRSKLELAAAGALSKCSTFDYAQLTAEELDQITPSTAHKAQWYRELVQPLAAQGREDLARAISRMLRRYAVTRTVHGCWNMLRTVDQQMLGGTLARAKRAFHVPRIREVPRITRNQ